MANQPELASDEALVASAVHFLIDGGMNEAARLLPSCTAHAELTGLRRGYDSYEVYEVELTIYASQPAYGLLEQGDGDPTAHAIRDAFRALVPPSCVVDSINLRAPIRSVTQTWRAEALAHIDRGEVHNQGLKVGDAQVLPWKHLRFRSQSEIRIAETLERKGILFLPNCLGRLKGPDGPVNREADFLICDQGRWGILEVDGEPFHPPSRTTQDHERDRLFKQAGIAVVEHYDASRCYNNPEMVVGEFLKLLQRNA